MSEEKFKNFSGNEYNSFVNNFLGLTMDVLVKKELGNLYNIDVLSLQEGIQKIKQKLLEGVEDKKEFINLIQKYVEYSIIEGIGPYDNLFHLFLRDILSTNNKGEISKVYTQLDVINTAKSLVDYINEAKIVVKEIASSFFPLYKELLSKGLLLEGIFLKEIGRGLLYYFYRYILYLKDKEKKKDIYLNGLKDVLEDVLNRYFKEEGELAGVFYMGFLKFKVAIFLIFIDPLINKKKYIKAISNSFHIITLFTIFMTYASYNKIDEIKDVFYFYMERYFGELGIHLRKEEDIVDNFERWIRSSTSILTNNLSTNYRIVFEIIEDVLNKIAINNIEDWSKVLNRILYLLENIDTILSFGKEYMYLIRDVLDINKDLSIEDIKENIDEKSRYNYLLSVFGKELVDKYGLDLLENFYELYRGYPSKLRVKILERDLAKIFIEEYKVIKELNIDFVESLIENNILELFISEFKDVILKFSNNRYNKELLNEVLNLYLKYFLDGEITKANFVKSKILSSNLEEVPLYANLWKRFEEIKRNINLYRILGGDKNIITKLENEIKKVNLYDNIFNLQNKLTELENLFDRFGINDFIKKRRFIRELFGDSNLSEGIKFYKVLKKFFKEEEIKNIISKYRYKISGIMEIIESIGTKELYKILKNKSLREKQDFWNNLFEYTLEILPILKARNDLTSKQKVDIIIHWDFDKWFDDKWMDIEKFVEDDFFKKEDIFLLKKSINKFCKFYYKTDEKVGLSGCKVEVINEFVDLVKKYNKFLKELGLENKYNVSEFVLELYSKLTESEENYDVLDFLNKIDIVLNILFYGVLRNGDENIREIKEIFLTKDSSLIFDINKLDNISSEELLRVLYDISFIKDKNKFVDIIKTFLKNEDLQELVKNVVEVKIVENSNNRDLDNQFTNNSYSYIKRSLLDTLDDNSCFSKEKFEAYSYKDFESLLNCLKNLGIEVSLSHSKGDHFIWVVNGKKITIPKWDSYPRFLINKIIKSIFTSILNTNTKTV